MWICVKTDSSCDEVKRVPIFAFRRCHRILALQSKGGAVIAQTDKQVRLLYIYIQRMNTGPGRSTSGLLGSWTGSVVCNARPFRHNLGCSCINFGSQKRNGRLLTSGERSGVVELVHADQA